MSAAGGDAAGPKLGRYHVAEPIGGGPTGEVFRAKVYGVAGFERQFAVKRFHAELVADPAAQAKLAAAARAHTAIEHPRIARVHEFGVAGGAAFVASELVEGVDLARFVEGTFGSGAPLLPGAALSVATQIARAVGYAHGRGVSHLGLCPTNVIATADGDVKVTDFGFLPARLPGRPADDSTLRSRLPYLAPEQLVGEPTSPATDVFELAVITYELLSGQRAFTGATSQEIAQRVLSSQPPDPLVPKPIIKALRRALARSPLERFPDASAFADALEAANRASPVPGGRRDLADAVRAAGERLASLSEAQASGAMSFPLPAPPRPLGERSMTERPLPDPPPLPIARTPPEPGREPESRRTLFGVMPRRPSTAGPHVDDDAPTNVKLTAAPPRGQPPPIPPPLAFPPTTVTAAPPPPPRPSSLRAGSDAAAVGVAAMPMPGAPAMPMPAGDAPRELPPLEPLLPRPERAETTSGAYEAIEWGEASRSGSRPGGPAGHEQETEPFTRPVLGPDRLPPPPMPGSPGPAGYAPFGLPPGIPRGLDGAALPLPPDGAVLAPLEVPPTELVLGPPRSGGAGKWLLLIGLLGLAAGGGWFGYQRLRGKQSATAAAPAADAGPSVASGTPTPTPPTTAVDAGAVAVKPAAPPDAAAAVAVKPPPDAAPVAVPPPSPPDAAAAVAVKPPPAPPDAAPAEPGPPPTGRGDKLKVTTTPRGAFVYLDGALLGKSPVTIDATADRHRLAVLLSGHELHTADIDGSGEVNITLDEVTPSGGPAGIKVLCRKKNRYYIIVDGAESGQLCPTERIHVQVGPHTVEVYDAVTDARQTYTADVKETHHSYRVRLE